VNAQTLKVLCQYSGLSQAELARRTKISRQAVSLWFKKENDINIQSKNQEALAHALGISQDKLSMPLPILDDPLKTNALETELLWDYLYPDLISYLKALLNGHSQAMARLVQVYGFFAAEKIIGKAVWSKFAKYKKYIHPAYRKKLEIIWKTQKDLALI